MKNRIICVVACLMMLVIEGEIFASVQKRKRHDLLIATC